MRIIFIRILAKIKKRKTALLVIFLLIAAGFLAGWFSKPDFSSPASGRVTPLRLNRYKFIGPLLVCNTSDQNSSNFASLVQKLNTLINQEIQRSNIRIASVFFQDLNTNRKVIINKDEKYYPASLGKIPVMIAYYEAVQTNPGILSKQIEFDIAPGSDKNAQQEIKPASPAQPNQVYTVEQLIEKMIVYSDNNAADVLTQNIGADAIHQVYNDFQLKYLDNPTTDSLDFMTVNDFSFFFRALYNNSYLGDIYSEKALEVLSRTDFNEGLVAGVPKGTQISHKFGLATIADGGAVTERELNDCGIVYHPVNPYVICVMTKSGAGLSDIDGTIQRISSLAWDEASNDYQ